MINLQLHIEIMRLGAGEGGGKNRMVSADRSSVWRENDKPRGMPRRPAEDLSQARREVGASVADLPMPELLDSRNSRDL